MSKSIKRITFVVFTVLASVLTFGLSQSAHAEPDVTITCESYGYNPASCHTGVQNDRVRLINQISHGRGRCELGSSWTYDNSYIYVNNGCRATFLVEPRVFNMGCSSWDYNTTRCSVPGQVLRVDLIEQQSHGRGQCQFNRNWGYDANGIWVNGGCRAVFRVERNLP